MHKPNTEASMENVQQEQTPSRRRQERRKEKRHEKGQNCRAWSRAARKIPGLSFPENPSSFIVPRMKSHTFISVLADPNTAASFSGSSRSFVVARRVAAMLTTATSLLQEKPQRLWHLSHVWDSAIQRLAARNPEWRVEYAAEDLCDVMDAFIRGRQNFLETQKTTNDDVSRAHKELISALDEWIKVEAECTFMSKTRRTVVPEPRGLDDDQTSGSAEREPFQLNQLEPAWKIYNNENRIFRHHAMNPGWTRARRASSGQLGA